MAWELTWPVAVIDAAVVFLIHGFFEASGESWDSIWVLASFFTVSPWVVRRALRREYCGFRVMVVRPNAVAETLSYQESLKVMWLLAWRTLVLTLAAFLVLSLVLSRFKGDLSQNISSRSPLVNSLGLSAGDALGSLLFSPILITGMLRKRYRGFHLEVRKKH